jgi:hypothetical protein
LHCSSGTPPTPTVGTCGGGNRGNGRCADSKLCCSKWGWCGTSTSHCSGWRNLRDTNNNSTMVMKNFEDNCNLCDTNMVMEKVDNLAESLDVVEPLV